MIARIWHGKTDKSKFGEYSEFLQKVAIPDYKKTLGLQAFTSFAGPRGQKLILC
jgi:hypothetical protein